MEKNILILRDLHKSFDDQPLLRGVTFEIARGEIACLLGPSGSGKSTLLRIIAGLEHAARGEIIFENQNLRDAPTHLRGIGMMFQDLALFPHRNVFDNIAFGLQMQRVPRREMIARVNELLRLVGLENFGARNVVSLSGGEQQRVALARTLAPRPRLLMFDEPLGALDRILREQLQTEVRDILKQIGMTALYVTHDQTEAFAVADRVLIIHDGIIAQSGAPQELFERPANAYIARFLGLSNLLAGEIARVDGSRAVVETRTGIFHADARGLSSGARGFVLLRPNAIAKISPLDSTPRENEIRGRVIEARYHANQSRVVIETRAGTRLTFDSAETIRVGAEICLALAPRAIQFLPE
ncbi:MAG: ABC transporter ATP-binding protein [Chloroflexi bacterium]|nr:ABC transporter ATP-binding protein [Chloroflexota bacterium]